MAVIAAVRRRLFAIFIGGGVGSGSGCGGSTGGRPGSGGSPGIGSPGGMGGFGGFPGRGDGLGGITGGRSGRGGSLIGGVLGVSCIALVLQTHGPMKFCVCREFSLQLLFGKCILFFNVVVDINLNELDILARSCGQGMPHKKFGHPREQKPQPSPFA